MIYVFSIEKPKIKVLVLSLILISAFFAEQENITPASPLIQVKENQQFLHGMVSVVKSLDTYLKGTYDTPFLNGENTEVNGSRELCTFVMMSQMPSKIDGFTRYYAKTGIVEYKELSQQLIDKMFKVYKSTKDKDGNNWLPTGHYLSVDGKFYGYSEGNNFPEPRPYDQSKGEFQIENAGMPDAWGIGMYELCKMTDYLDPGYKEKLIEVLYGMADFWNRDYMLYRKLGTFFYRTEDVTPLNPKPQKKELQWWCLGVDLVYSITSLQELGQNTDKYDERLILLLQTYVKDRPLHNEDFRIDYLDSRMIELSKYFRNKGKEKELSDWVFKKLPGLYKDRVNKAHFMLNGDVRGSSTIPLLDLYAQLNMKDQYRGIWKDIWDNKFGELGVKNEEDNTYLSVNNSGYALLLDAGYQGWLTGMISDEEFNKAVKKYYEFKGDRRNYRDCDDWVIETEEWDKVNKNWKATPYEFYPEQVEPEHYYFGKPQGFTVHRAYIQSDMEAAMKKENQTRNAMYQFTAPFENHAEKERYGLAQTFNILDIAKNNTIRHQEDLKEETTEFNMKYKEPKVPKGIPCAGFVDVTELYYKDKKEAVRKGYEISEVLLNGKKISYQVFHLLDYKKPRSGENNAKLGFLIEAEGKEKEGEIKVVATKTKLPYYISDENYNENVAKTRLRDLPVVERQNQTSTVDTFTLKDAIKAGKYVSSWEQWCLAYRGGESKVKKELEKAIRETAIGMEAGDYNRNRLVEIVIALTRIYYVYEDKSKEELAKNIEKYANDVLNEKEAPKGVNILRDGEMLIRYGILFPERSSAKECLDAGWEKFKKYLKENFNAEGFDKYRDPIEDIKILTEIERLCLINDVKIPEEVFKMTEKVLELLMYCSNPDGTVSEVVDKTKQNVREWLYWGGKIYKRADFRYVSFGGLDMENSFEPEKTSVAYPESGIYVMRNSWDIRDRAKYGLKDETRQRVMVINAKDFYVTVSGFNRVLATIFPEKYRYTVSKWSSNATGDELLLVDEKNMEKREIRFENKEYWIVKSKGTLEEKAEIYLNGLEIVQTNDHIRAETIRTPEEDIEENRFSGRVQIASYAATNKVSGNSAILTGVGAISYVIYPYCDSNEKCTYEKIVDEKSFKQKPTDYIITVIGKAGRYYKRVIPYVPDIKFNGSGGVVINK